MRTYKCGYRIGEPIVNSKGENVVLAVENNNCIVQLLGLKELKTTPDLRKLVDRNLPWPATGDFSKLPGKTVEDTLSEDLIEAFRNVGQRIQKVLRENIYFVSDEYFDVCTCFIVSSYFMDVFSCSPRVIMSGVTSSGKTRLQGILRDLCYRGLKIGNASFAAAFRLADEFSPTIILEEFQDTIAGGGGNQTKIDLFSMIKVGFQKGEGVVKCNPTTLIPEYFSIFGPIALSTKSLNRIPEDVINRSFVIKMTEAPTSYKLKKSLDLKELESIRQDLYHLMFTVDYQRMYHNATTTNKSNIGFDFDDYIRECASYLEGQPYDEKYADLFKQECCELYPTLTNRIFDMATTMFPIASLLGITKGMYTSLEESKERSINCLKATGNSVVLDSWIELIKERNPMSRGDFLHIAHSVSTASICLKCNELGSDIGDLGEDRRTLETRDMRRPLMNMGFELKKGAHNLTYPVDIPHFREFFETNLEKFGSEENKEYYKKLNAGPESKDCVKTTKKNKGGKA